MSDCYTLIYMECYSNVLKKLQPHFQKSSAVNNCRGQHVMDGVVDNCRGQHVMYTNLIHALVPHFLFHIKTKTLGTTTNLTLHVNEWTKHRMPDTQRAHRSKRTLYNIYREIIGTGQLVLSTINIGFLSQEETFFQKI